MARLHLLDDNGILWRTVVAAVTLEAAPAHTGRARHAGTLPTTGDLCAHTRFVVHQSHTRSASNLWKNMFIETNKKFFRS